MASIPISEISDPMCGLRFQALVLGLWSCLRVSGLKSRFTVLGHWDALSWGLWSEVRVACPNSEISYALTQTTHLQISGHDCEFWSLWYVLNLRCYAWAKAWSMWSWLWAWGLKSSFVVLGHSVAELRRLWVEVSVSCPTSEISALMSVRRSPALISSLWWLWVSDLKNGFTVLGHWDALL